MSMKEVKESMGEGVGGKSVRGCDNCVRRSAGWYCAADDAFLCETCDSSVHSANPLARRHERVRLKSPPSWHRGFTKKPRTPRRHKRIPMHLVPDCSDEESDDNLLYRVPVFNNPIRDGPENHDLESLLGFDFDDENEEEKNLLQIDLGRETFELNFDCAQDEQDNKMLKLDHGRVMSAWDENKSPWMSGERPELSTGDCEWWTQHCCLGTSGAMHGYGEMAVARSGEREARVSRYREKRRTRLFSKKIRYEVRKLNAEKRPRMKGRFVKRASAFP